MLSYNFTEDFIYAIFYWALNSFAFYNIFFINKTCNEAEDIAFAVNLQPSVMQA